MLCVYTTPLPPLSLLAIHTHTHTYKHSKTVTYRTGRTSIQLEREANNCLQMETNCVIVEMDWAGTIFARPHGHLMMKAQ